MKKFAIILGILFLGIGVFAVVNKTQGTNEANVKIAKLKYRGGGDWYANRTALPNLIEFCNKNLNTSIASNEEIVEPDAPDIFNYPFIYLTGHGKVSVFVVMRILVGRLI